MKRRSSKHLSEYGALLDEAANAEKAGLVEVKRQHPNYDFNTLNELAQLKH